MIKRSKQIGVAAGAVVAAAAFWLACSNYKASAGQSGHSLPAVVVALATRGPLANSITLSGEFRPFQEVDVHAKVAGFIRTIYVDVGDHVKSAQVLAVLEVPELNAEVMGAKADIRRSEDAIHRAQSELRRSESGYSAYHAAYTRLEQASEARPGLIAAQELDDSQAKDKEAEAQVESSRAALAEAQSQLSAAHANLDRLSAMEAYSHISAPFAGVVTKRYADTGALIQAGTTSDTQSMPVVRLAEWSLLRLVVPVPESAVPQLHLGTIVQVHVSALNRDFAGKVARFADALSDQTRTMHTEIDVENPEGTLKEGMYAEVKLLLQQKKEALTVPVQAVVEGGNENYVLILDDHDRVQKRTVQLGEQTSTRVEILSGISENERVISAGQSNYETGEVVKPRLERESSDAGGNPAEEPK
jgi:RND family efflux transporter MFP subunit